MQITLDIPNQKIAKHLLWMLAHFEKDGVKIYNISEKTVILKNSNTVNDMQIQQNWKEILLNCNSKIDHYKSEQFKIDKAEKLAEKYQ